LEFGELLSKTVKTTLVVAAVITAHEEGLNELDKTSFGGVTFAMSMDIEQAFFSSLQSGNHLLHISLWKINILEGSDSFLVDSSIKLLSLINSWVIAESSVGSKNDGLN